MTVDDLLVEALAAQAKGALLVDIRGDDQHRVGGLWISRTSQPSSVDSSRAFFSIAAHWRGIPVWALPRITERRAMPRRTRPLACCPGYG
jgi:hypothetical protein